MDVSRATTLPLTPPTPGAITRCDLMWSASDNCTEENVLFTPVQGCEIHPFVIVRNSRGQMHDDDDLDVSENPLKMHYRWRRGPARAVCFFHPHRTASIQCTITLRCFCAYHCFDRGHKQLRRFYASGGKCPLPRQTNEFSYGVPCRKITASDLDAIRDSDETHHRLLRQAGLVVDPEHETWQVISYSRNFAPRKDDVGHQLRFECLLTCEETDRAPAVVRVITSAGEVSEQASSKLQESAAVGPRSSPVDILRKAQPDPEAEERFWTAWDQSPKIVSSDTFKSVLTSCVVPQAPLIEPRPIIPVGILALFSGNQPSAQSPQRVIPPNSPLARALGIGLANGGKRRQLATIRNHDDPLVRLSNRYAMQQNGQYSTIAERRESLLTDHAFASWGKGASKADAKTPTTSKHSTRTFSSNDAAHRLRGITPNPKLSSTAFGVGLAEASPAESFTVMTWNVLADIYATTDAYPYCEPFVLAWNYRRERLLSEMLSYNPDVMCLQEVQADHFEEFFAPALLKRGYEGLYKHKTSRVFRGSGKHRGGKYLCDGCATFFKVPKFRLVDHFGIEFARVAPPTARTDSKSDKRLNKDNVALVLCLEQVLSRSKVKSSPDDGNGTTTTTRRLVVANTHILANPEAPDVKIWQANTLTSVLTEYMEKSVSYARLDGSARVPGLVICGDFNSTPDSAVYQLVTAGACDSRHEELQSSDIYKWLHDIPLGHGLNLRSSYGAANYMRIEAEKALASSNGNGQQYVLSHGMYEPEFTNYTHSYVGCLDYIFFDDRCLKLTGTLELLKEIQLLEEAHALQLSDWALPSPQRPSDHTPLLSRFEWVR